MQATTAAGQLKPSFDDIAKFVKDARAFRQWKQLALAAEAGVTEKTIEHLESGKARTSEESLTKIAKAFKLPDRFLIDPGFWPSEEELAVRAEFVRRTCTTAELHNVTKSMDLDNILDASAYLIDASCVDESLAEKMASLRQGIEDCGDIYIDLPHTSKLNCCRDLLSAIREMESHGYTAKWGRYIPDENCRTAVLVFQKTAGVPSEHQVRIAIVPRSLFPGIV